MPDTTASGITYELRDVNGAVIKVHRNAHHAGLLPMESGLSTLSRRAGVTSVYAHIVTVPAGLTLSEARSSSCHKFGAYTRRHNWARGCFVLQFFDENGTGTNFSVSMRHGGRHSESTGEEPDTDGL